MSEKIITYLTALKHQEKMINSIKNANCIDDLAVDTGDFLEMALLSLFEQIREQVIVHFNEFYNSLRNQAEQEMTSSDILDKVIQKLRELDNADA